MIIHLTIFHSTNVASSNKCPTHTHTVAGGNDTSKVTVAGGNNTSTEPPTIAQAKSVSEEQQTSPPVNSNNNNNNTQTSPPVNSNNNNYTAINETTVNNNNDTSVGNNNNDTSSSPVLLCPVVGTPATPAAPPAAVSAVASSKKVSGWKKVITDAEFARPREDGKSVGCEACLGIGKNRGEVKMRHSFALGAWDEHCDGKKHKAAIANILAEREKDNPMKNKKQSAMGVFFPVIKKKKGKHANDPQSVAVGTSGRTTAVDLTVDDNSTRQVLY